MVVNNGALAGTTSSYITACFKMHVPTDADIVMVECKRFGGEGVHEDASCRCTV